VRGAGSVRELRHTCKVNARFPIEVERFVVPQREGAEVRLDSLGMLMAPVSAAIPGNGLLRVTDLASAGSFCLLGEPGAGKTTALGTVVRDVPDVASTGPEQDAVLTVSLAEVTDLAAFRERVCAPALARAGASGGGRLTVVLDGLDECPVPGAGKALAGLLRDFLGQVDATALRVIVGCRSAEYPQAVHDVLQSMLKPFGRFELAPLSRRDVAELASSRGVSAADFLAEVARTGTGPLASLPLSLDLLLRQFSESGRVPGTPVELYGAALRSLADEPDPHRDPARVLASGEQAFVVAARLCCYLLLCGRSAFWTGPAGQAADSDLIPHDLAGGQERQAGGEFPVTRQLIDAALRSGSFTARGPSRVVPAHAAFAGFLAAWYLVAHQVPDVQLAGLLGVRTVDGQAVAPPLRDAAAWVIAQRSRAVEWMSGADIAWMVDYAARFADQQTRGLITQRLLADQDAFLIGTASRLEALAHPDLTVQLLPVLSRLADPAATQPTQEQADIALALAPHATSSVVPGLLGIACRQDLDAAVRGAAACTVARFDRGLAAATLTRMLAEVSAYPARDPADEIRGIALSALWPSHLSAEELVASLAIPKRNAPAGAYLAFCRSLPARLSDDDVPHVLRWFSDHAISDRWDISLEDLLDRALDCESPDLVIGPAADLAAGRLLGFIEIRVPPAMSEYDADGVETRRSRLLRRLLAEELIDRYPYPRHITYMICWGWQPPYAAHTEAGFRKHRRYADDVGYCGLLDSADLGWLIDTALARNNDEIFVGPLAVIFDPADPRARQVAWRMRDTSLWRAFAGQLDRIVAERTETGDYVPEADGDLEERGDGADDPWAPPGSGDCVPSPMVQPDPEALSDESLADVLWGEAQAMQEADDRNDYRQVVELEGSIARVAQLIAARGHEDDIADALDLIHHVRDGGGSVRWRVETAIAGGLLKDNPRRHWDYVFLVLMSSPSGPNAKLEGIANIVEPFLNHLSEVQLASLWARLHGLTMEAADTSQRTRRFSSLVLNAIADCGSSEAVSELRQLATHHPQVPDIKDYAREAEEFRLGRAWEPIRPADLTRLLQDARARLVRSSAELADLVTRAIGEASEELTRTGQLLWNNTNGPGGELWRPKSESDVGAWLAERLSERLVRSGVIVNREVMVRQTTGKGHGLAVDIQADATPANGRDAESARCRIELKGNWNPDLKTAMRTQLADDYLVPDGLSHGIYVTAWFDTRLWTDERDGRRRQALSIGREEIEKNLIGQVISLRDSGLDIRTVIIDIPRPMPSKRR
jgi:hypothetical protein